MSGFVLIEVNALEGAASGHMWTTNALQPKRLVHAVISEGCSYLSRGCLCVGRRRSRHTRSNCRRSCQILTRSTDTDCSCTPLARCTPACPRLPGRRSGTCCWPRPPGTHSGRPGSPAHSGRCHNCKCLQRITFINGCFILLARLTFWRVTFKSWCTKFSVMF